MKKYLNSVLIGLSVFIIVFLFSMFGGEYKQSTSNLANVITPSVDVSGSSNCPSGFLK